MTTAAKPAPVAYLTPALQFVQTPFHPNDRGNMLLRFRERGFAVVSNVFERDSVDAYLDQIRSLVIPGTQWWAPYLLPQEDPITVYPALAPRLRSALAGGFMPWIAEPSPALLAAAWLIKPSNPDERLVHDWHKDGDHVGATSIHGYTHPAVIHVNMYFADTTIEHGPTYVIPGSHRDPTLSPFGGAKEEPLICNKGDVVIWDQRLWHRASPRTVEGLRIVGIFAFYPVPVCGMVADLSPAQKAAYASAKTPEEMILFSGSGFNVRGL